MLSYSDTIFRFQNKIYDDYGIQKHKDFVRDFLSIAQEEA
jgi:hypothetical protein